jgi:uncharacterized protein YuzE
VSRASRLVTSVALIAASGCADLPDAFTCTDVSQCSDQGLAGYCEPSGYCSFDDEACDSGRRYGSYAREDLAEACVTSGQRVESLTLIDADLDTEVIGYEILPAAVVVCINAATTGCPAGAATVSKAMTVRANTSPPEVGSVQFRVNGAVEQTENTAPYAVGTETNGDYKAWIPGEGVHDLDARPFSEENAAGTPGISASVSVEVIILP